MSLSIPSYIPVRSLRRTPIFHDWDAYDPYSILPAVQVSTLESLCHVSDRALIAFAIGCSEWVVFRFLDYLSDDRALSYLEACWVFEVSENVYLPREQKAEEWTGRVLAAIDLSMLTIINTVYFTEDGQGHLKAAFAECLPLHVIAEVDLFITWRDLVLKRLCRLFPRDASNPWGAAVPRQALDPDFPIDRVNIPGIMYDFLEQASGNVYVQYKHND